jgi:hypothetical protein
MPERKFVKELSIVLIGKLILLLIVWFLFFQAPVQKPANAKALFSNPQLPKSLVNVHG